MFGDEGLGEDKKRQTYSIAISDEVKVAELKVSFFEEVLMIYYE